VEEEVEGKIFCSSIRLSFCLSASPAFFIFFRRSEVLTVVVLEVQNYFLYVTHCTLKMVVHVSKDPCVFYFIFIYLFTIFHYIVILHAMVLL